MSANNGRTIVDALKLNGGWYAEVDCWDEDFC
jgi:hypothetical protein